ncbi:hypothetical protein D3C81_1217670 [compost metagenome]
MNKATIYKDIFKATQSQKYRVYFKHLEDKGITALIGKDILVESERLGDKIIRLCAAPMNSVCIGTFDTKEESEEFLDSIKELVSYKNKRYAKSIKNNYDIVNSLEMLDCSNTMLLIENKENLYYNLKTDKFYYLPQEV